MPLVPVWAPNLHPLVIHFPIVLLIVAAAVDLADAIVRRPAWLPNAGTSLYVAGAAAAVGSFLTGQSAALTVYIPGMAHPIVNDHWAWATVATAYFVLVALVRVAMHLTGRPSDRSRRLWLLTASLIGLVLLQQTAERGARLVYEQGVGVIAAPGSR